MALISIIIPTYNMARLLPDALQSVFSNSFKDIEIIILDDGSTDGTAEIVSRFKDDNKEKAIPIRYHKISQRGKGGCLNEIFSGLSIEGDYIVFMDADDVLPADSLQQRYDAITASGSEMVIGKFAVTNMHGEILETRPLNQKETKETLIKHFLFSPKTPFHLNGTIITEKLLFRTGPFDESFHRGQEMDYSIRLLKEARDFKILPKVVYLYRKYQRSLKLRLNIRLQNIHHRFRFINKHAKGGQKFGALVFHTVFNASKFVYDLFKNYNA